MQTSALIVGGGGFVGYHLVRSFVLAFSPFKGLLSCSAANTPQHIKARRWCNIPRWRSHQPRPDLGANKPNPANSNCPCGIAILHHEYAQIIPKYNHPRDLEPLEVAKIPPLHSFLQSIRHIQYSTKELST
jgi:hypothetical protein